MNKIFPDLPEWTFTFDEVSAGVYEVIGHDKVGHSVSVKGIDLDAIIEESRIKAKNIKTNKSNKSNK